MSASVNLPYEEQELTRAITMLCSGYEACFDWWTSDSEEEDSPEEKSRITIEDILRYPAFSVVDAPMVRAAIGMEIVTLEFLAPLNGFFPERLAIGIHPDYLPLWKDKVIEGLDAFFAYLREDLLPDESPEGAEATGPSEEAP